MANKHEDHLAQCPYYKTNTSQVIHCEGPEKDMKTHMTFATHPQLVDYKSRFCRRMCYGKCLWAHALDQKWGADDDE